MIKKYVCGFCFTRDHVLLIRKSKPDWQKGKLNGIGGKLEEGETIFFAMTREFLEETGIYTNPEEWRPICLYKDTKERNYEVFFFALHGVSYDRLRSLPGKVVTNPQGVEEGVLGLFSIHDLPSNVIYNLRWLIPMALDDSLYSYDCPTILGE